MSIAANPAMITPPSSVMPSGYSLSAVRSSRSGFLVFVWIAVALGVFAMFEPSPSDVGIAVLAVAGIVFGKLRWERSLTLTFVLLGFFVFANLVSSCYAIDFDSGAIYILVTLFMLVSWVFVTGVLVKYQERGLLALMSAYTIGGAASSLLAVLAYFHVVNFGESLLFYDRIKGAFKDPNVFGAYLVIASVYALYRLQGRGSFARKIFWAGACLSATLGVLLSFSRAAWANYAVTLVLFFVLNLFANRSEGSTRKRLVYIVIILTVISAAILYATTIPQVSDVIAYRSEIQAYDIERFATYEAALKLGLDNPLGVGPGQSFLLLDYATHNLYLRIFSENGVIGFLSLTIFMLATLLRSLVLSQKALTTFQRSMFSLVAAALAGSLLNSFAIDTLHWRHFWLLLAIGWMPAWKQTQEASSRSASRQEIPAQVITDSEALAWR